MPRVIWSRRSRSDLAALRRTYHNPDKAKAIATRLCAIAEHFEHHADLGRLGSVSGTRELVVMGTPYVLIYAVSDDRSEVFVLAIVDARSDWK